MWRRIVFNRLVKYGASQKVLGNKSKLLITCYLLMTIRQISVVALSD
jgi:hypothetical protein